MSSCPSAEGKTPHQTNPKQPNQLWKALSPSALNHCTEHHSGAGIPAPLPLIHERPHAGAGKRAGKNFFRGKKKKKAAAPFLSRCCYGPAGLTTDGRRAIPAAGSEAVHSSMPFAFPAFRRDTAPALSSPRGAGMWGAAGRQILPGYRISGLSLLRAWLTGTMGFANQRLGLFVRPCSGLTDAGLPGWRRQQLSG